MRYLTLLLALMSTWSFAAEKKTSDDQKPLKIYWFTDGCDDPVQDWYSFVLDEANITLVKQWVVRGEANTPEQDLAIAKLLQLDLDDVEIARYGIVEIRDLNTNAKTLIANGVPEGKLGSADELSHWVNQINSNVLISYPDLLPEMYQRDLLIPGIENRCGGR